MSNNTDNHKRSTSTDTSEPSTSTGNGEPNTGTDTSTSNSKQSNRTHNREPSNRADTSDSNRDLSTSTGNGEPNTGTDTSNGNSDQSNRTGNGDSSNRTDSMPGWVKQAVIWFWLGALGAFYAVGVVRALRSLILVIVVSLFLSFAIEPAVNRLERRGIRRGYGTGLVFLGFIAATVGIIAMIGTALASESQSLIDKSPEYIDSFEEWANNTFNLDLDFDTLRQEFVDGGGVEDLVRRFADDVVNIGATLVGVLFQIFTVALFTFYLVAEGPKFRSLVSGLLDERRRAVVLEVWDLAIEKSGAYIYSRTALAAVSALFHWLIFVLLGVPSPLALALWVGLVSQFIPTIGTYFAGALPVLIGLLHDPSTGLWTLIAIVLYQQIENYLLSPRITAQTMDIHVALSFGSVIAGLALLGPVGALLALPFAATTQAFISSWRARNRQAARSAES